MSSQPFKKRTDAEQWDIDRPRIHALKNKVMLVRPGFSDENYRDIILGITSGRGDSSTDMTRQERRELISRLAELAGEEPQRSWQPRDKRSYPGRPKNMDKPGESRADQLGKIEALLTVGKRPWSYADALAKRICRNADGVPLERIALVPTGELYKVITALRKQAQREGWYLSGEK